MNILPNSQLILYQSEDGATQIQVTMQDETVWLTQKEMTELFQRDKSVISRHIQNIFNEGELDPEATVAIFATVQQEGHRTITREVEYYNLEVIISVGYRVKSHRGTQFRVWATQTLREYLVKGFVINDERLKGNERNDFDELVERVRRTRRPPRPRNSLPPYKTSFTTPFTAYRHRVNYRAHQ